ncbi:hypothetical protein J41TS4_39050 [Paenibacillus apis]|uniref:Uncharacterized protein n=1 Tax=Paenibacillus apis TaxID=1792174 RepID=A0A919Y3V1_9BACL|nr:hypothetical protein J41TS4_39050 [Paenibacillus apis]
MKFGNDEVLVVCSTIHRQGDPAISQNRLNELKQPAGAAWKQGFILPQEQTTRPTGGYDSSA